MSDLNEVKNKCYGCGKPVGNDYLSHPRTDCKGDDGVNWADTAICLCEGCANDTAGLVNVSEFVKWKEVVYPPKPSASQGPWKADGRYVKTDIEGQHVPYVVAQTGVYLFTNTDREGVPEANANLIAAAPDFAALVKDFLELWPLTGYELEAYCDATLVPAMQEAMRKAKGG